MLKTLCKPKRVDPFIRHMRVVMNQIRIFEVQRVRFFFYPDKKRFGLFEKSYANIQTSV